MITVLIFWLIFGSIRWLYIVITLKVLFGERILLLLLFHWYSWYSYLMNFDDDTVPVFVLLLSLLAEADLMTFFHFVLLVFIILFIDIVDDRYYSIQYSIYWWWDDYGQCEAVFLFKYCQYSVCVCLSIIQYCAMKMTWLVICSESDYSALKKAYSGLSNVKAVAIGVLLFWSSCCVQLEVRSWLHLAVPFSRQKLKLAGWPAENVAYYVCGLASLAGLMVFGAVCVMGLGGVRRLSVW